MRSLVEEVTPVSASKIPCGRDGEGFYVVNKTYSLEGVEVPVETAAKMQTAVEAEFRKVERQILETANKATSAIDLIDKVNSLSKKAEELQNLYNSLGQIVHNEIFVKRIYLS